MNAAAPQNPGSAAARPARAERSDRLPPSDRQAQAFERLLGRRSQAEEEAGSREAAEETPPPPLPDLPWRFQAMVAAGPDADRQADAIDGASLTGGRAALSAADEAQGQAGRRGIVETSAAMAAVERRLQAGAESSWSAGSTAAQALTAAAAPRSVEMAVELPLGLTLQVQATQAAAAAGVPGAPGQAPWRLTLGTGSLDLERIARHLPRLEGRLRARGLLEGDVGLQSQRRRGDPDEDGQA